VIRQIKRSWRHFLLLLTVHWWFNVAAIDLWVSNEERLEQYHCEDHWSLGYSLEALGKLWASS
jgi:hypothetical protein